MNKTIKNYKSLKVSVPIKSIRKIFETILSGNVSLADCVLQAYDLYIIYPDSFENEMLQICVDYVKKCIETSDIDNTITNCVLIMTFIGKLYNMEAISSDATKAMLNFLTKHEVSLCKTLTEALFNVIYEKINELDDGNLKPFIPAEFEKIPSNGVVSESEFENEIKAKAVSTRKEEGGGAQQSSSSTLSSCQLTPKKVIITETLSLQQQQKQLAIVSMSENSAEPIDKFRELINKLSPTNVAYILREIALIRFGATSGGEENVKDLSAILVEQAISKQTLVKSIAQIVVKLPETIVPHFNSSLMRKNIKSVVLSKILKCSEKESLGYSQLVKELHSANYYDRFDIIILLESFMENLNTDRTALSSLLKFINEVEEIICSKKLSKNIRTKLNNIAQVLASKISDADSKESIEAVLKILRGESVKIQNNKEKYENNVDDEITDYTYDNNNNSYDIRYICF